MRQNDMQKREVSITRSSDAICLSPKLGDVANPVT
jgi:hypothetical protein